MVRLSELVERFGGVCENPLDETAWSGADPEVADVHLDSRSVQSGSLFAALPGARMNGANFVGKACERGAVAVLSPERLPSKPAGRTEADVLPSWIHPEARRVVGEAAARVHGHPSRSSQTIGITGTNGKTTVAHIVRCLLEGLGRKPAMVGTIEVRLWGAEPRVASHTTPDATELQRICRENNELGGDSVVLEASSHALDQDRLAGFELDVAVFTNLSRDHLDYHPDMDAYAAAKERIFAHVASDGVAAINVDDDRSAQMIAAAKARGLRVVTYGLGSRADLSASRLDVGPQGTHLFLEGMGISWTGLFLPLVGLHNVENSLAALAAVLSLGASPSRALEGLAAVSSPPGRLEPVDTGARGFQVFVDYAHTPDALERVLETLRSMFEDPEDTSRSEEGRLICVFGCGGDRDADKRAPMGEVVGRLADIAVVTSDNPRFEDPEEIIEAVLAGMTEAQADIVVETERRAAVRRALRIAERGDVILIAGKGHEAWQLLRGQRLPFEDARVVREELP